MLLTGSGRHPHMLQGQREPLHARYAQVVGYRRSPGYWSPLGSARIAVLPALLWSAVVVKIRSLGKGQPDQALGSRRDHTAQTGQSRQWVLAVVPPGFLRFVESNSRQRGLKK